MTVDLLDDILGQFHNIRWASKVYKIHGIVLCKKSVLCFILTIMYRFFSVQLFYIKEINNRYWADLAKANEIVVQTLLQNSGIKP